MKQTRNFDEWLSTMTDTVADWTYYTDFPKVYKNVSSIKVALNIMNSLIG
ncbi:TPA: restriction endonuclease, partial [Streptococcus pneumoniae]|nr:restriction endonuclease [Streptococcus pneumoniae]HEV2586651.1 restriction endonuclease [Streptococcus pneumoniae]